MQFAHEVVERRRSIQGAINEVRHPSVLDVLADEDFRILGEASTSRPPIIEFSLALARLTHAAARAKGFDRQIVDAALRLDALLPADDTSRERETLLRDAYRLPVAVAMPGVGGRRWPAWASEPPPRTISIARANCSAAARNFR